MAFNFETFGEGKNNKPATNNFDFETFGTPTTLEEKTGTWSKVIPDFIKESAVKRYQNIVTPETPKSTLDVLVSKAPLQKEKKLFGEGAGFVNDIIGGLTKQIASKVLPEKQKIAIKGFISSIGESAPVQTVVQKWNEFSQANPETAKDLSRSVNILSLLPVGKGAQLAGKEGLAIAEDVASLTAKSAVPKETLNATKILDEYTRAIKPSVTGKSTLPQVSAYKEAVVDAVDSIYRSKAKLELTDEAGNVLKGELPSTLNEFSQAIHQTKKEIFKLYDDLAQKSGQQGGKVALADLTGDLDTIINNKTLKIAKPEAIRYAAELKNRLVYDTVDNADGTVTRSLRQPLSTSDAQDLIKHYNDSLEAFYRNPSYDSASRAAIDALVVNKLRQVLDETIAKSQGAGYGALKKRYGSLSKIEKDVVKRNQVVARQNVKGLIDFTDIGTGSAVVYAILNQNPAVLGSALASKAFQKYIKYLNSPDRAVQSMFNAYAKFGTKSGLTDNLLTSIRLTPKQKTVNTSLPNNTNFVPKSQTGKFLQEYIKNPKAGLSTNPIAQQQINAAVFDHLDEITDAVNTANLRGRQINLDAIEFIDRLKTQKIDDLSHDEVRQIYEILAATKRTDIIDSINTQIAKNITPTKSIPKQNPVTGKLEGSMKASEAKLLEEAKKYKSAEEFVKAQGERVFRGGNKSFDKTLIGKDGVFVTPSRFMAETFGNKVDELYISPKAKVLSYNELPDSIKAIDNWDDYSTVVSKYGREKGFDVIDSLPPKPDFPRGMERTILNPEIIQTKSQLIDIWKKANKK